MSCKKAAPLTRVPEVFQESFAVFQFSKVKYLLGLASASVAYSVPQEMSFGNEASCKKREDYLEWPEYFMAVAFLSAQRSKDPSSQVGACIVNSENKIVGIGYNGMPNGCSDDVLPWTRAAAHSLDTKYPYVCHAELNAIMNKNSADVKGCSMYVALFPCNECAKLIIQAGIKEVIFMSDKYHDSIEMTAARRMFDLAGIVYREFKPKCNKIIIDFNSINSRPSQKLL
ncbi:deoxycytidylate deaminase isoform X5 [Gallus gallus]|nr:deoxycytidylate deaminase isoform X5 [Gallus gallus]